MKKLTVLLALFLLCGPALGQRIVVEHASKAASTYTGPGDISAASEWFGTRGYNAAFAAPGTNKAENIRCSSGSNVNSAFDIDILTTGDLDTATAATDCGNDGSVTASAATTVLSITALGSGQVAIGDQITGSGFVAGTYVISAGTCVSGSVVPPCTFNLNFTNTVSSEAVTAAAGIAITEAYDQTGNGHNATQVTAGKQPFLLLNVKNGHSLFACLAASSQGLTFSPVNSAQPFTIATVSERTGVFTSQVAIMWGNGSNIGYWTSTNTIVMYAGSNVTATASDSTLHALTGVYNGASSSAVVDGSATTVNPGGAGFSSSMGLCVNQAGTNPMTGMIGQAGGWPIGFSSTQYGNLHTQDASWWGTP